MSSNVLCPAPITAVLIDTNKGVRPCCVYDGYIGNLHKESLINIISSDQWKTIKQSMYDNIWPNECLSCKEREESSGWSVRKLFTDGNFNVTGWENDKITYLEMNGSNICNLACLHCNAGFSSKWVQEVKKAREVFNTYDHDKQNRMKWMDAVIIYNDSHIGNHRTTKVHLPNPDLILENLKKLDLSDLKTINFKGGEPFLNEETYIVLDYLNTLGILENIEIKVSTNGTYITDQYIDLLKKVNYIDLYISLDGVGELFNYIRYGEATFESIEPTIAKLNTLSSIQINTSTAVMNYNIYNLIDIRNYCIKMAEKYDKMNKNAGFANCLQHPRYLALNTLFESTRNSLVEFYEKNNSNTNHKEFDYVIQSLKNEYSGNDLHNNWIDYTLMMQTVRKNNILDIVPQLESDFKYV